MHGLNVSLVKHTMCCGKQITQSMRDGNNDLGVNVYVRKVWRRNQYIHRVELSNYPGYNLCLYYMGIICCLGWTTTQYRPCSAKVGICCTHVVAAGVLANLLIFVLYGALSFFADQRKFFVLCSMLLISLSHIVLMYPRVCN